jgi:hypothetical protein
MGQKSHVEVQHAQKSTELTVGLWRVAVLEMGHSLFQRLRTFGGNLVTEEGNSGARKMHFARLIMIPYLWSWVKRALRCCSCEHVGAPHPYTLAAWPGTNQCPLKFQLLALVG